jgi:hypothetical protein
MIGESGEQCCKQRSEGVAVGVGVSVTAIAVPTGVAVGVSQALGSSHGVGG